MRPKQFFYILGGLTAATFLLTSFVYIRYAAGFRAKNQTLGRTLADITAAEDKSTALSLLKTDYEKRVKPELGQITAALPKDKNQETVINQINRLADQTGVSVPSVTAGVTTIEQSGATAIPLNFSAVGPYENLYMFLQGVEKIIRASDITEVGFTRTDETSVTASFKLNVFYKP